MMRTMGQRLMDNNVDEIYEKIRKQGAVDFHSTTDPIILETWLKRTQRVLNLMKFTPEGNFDYAVSLL